MAGEVQAGYSGAEVSPVWFREKTDSREQFIPNAVIGVLEVSLGLSQGAAQYTLGKSVTHTHTQTQIITSE